MAVNDKTLGDKNAAEPLDPQSLSLIERIFYYEHLAPLEADNDNKSTPSAAQGSACFDAWAMPDYMRN